MTQPHVHAGPKLRSAVVLVTLTAALAACSTVTKSTSTEEQDTAYAAAPTNIASLSEVVQRNPADPQAYNMRGTVLGRAGRYEEALADFDKAVSLDPNYAQAYANR
ncbi:MAG TPA: tetratricopeptide repeat protein, partial [Xanthobacteraceae bacterium]|nr:tetratricopeptide repeat protein [Xanthobacteraceae bacterium]